MQVNFIDKIISFVDPSAGLKRLQRRSAMDVIQRGYEGARKDRRTKGWFFTDFEDRNRLSEIKTLKNRSRDLYRNNPYSYRAHNSIANNTTGIGILPAISQEGLKKVWKDWATDITVDFDGNLNFYGLQNLCMRTMSMHGEVLILRIKTNNKKNVPLELKIISTRYLDHTHDTEETPTGGFVTGGIEFDKNGKRKGYWIYPKDPNTRIVESVFWKDEDVIHLFKVEEPEQTHGVPFGTASMMSLRDYDDYADAQLMRQKIAACFSIFITKTDADMAGDLTGVSDAEDNDIEKVEPGLISHLDPGKNVTFASPPPAEGYAEYSRNVLTGVASGYGMSYESMTGDLSGVNYSSGRMGWIEYQRMIESWQELIIIPKLCKTVWRWFIEAGQLSGLIPANAPLSVEWTPPARKMIDPVKEVNGLLNKVRAGFISWQEAVRSLGFTPEEILKEMKESTNLFDKAGVRPRCDPRFDVGNLKNENNADSNKN